MKNIIKINSGSRRGFYPGCFSFALEKLKTTVPAFLLIICLVSPAWAQSPEEASIKKVLRDAPEASYKRDADKWQSLWVHDARSSRTFVNIYGFNSQKDWSKFSPAILKDFKDNPTPINPTLTQENFQIRVDGKLAFAEYDQSLSNLPDDPTRKNRSREMRVLVKENNQWKIASATSIDLGAFDTSAQAIEDNMNATGYKLLTEKKIDEAIEVFLLNVKLNPNAWNPYDSLGEAYAAKGEKALAIKNYEKSIELNPKNDNGKDWIKKLKGQ